MIIVIEILVIAYFLPLVCYNFIFGFASIFPTRNKTKKQTDHLNKIVVLIPGYKEDEIIVDTAKHALKQTYDKNSYDVVIIADSFQEDTLAELNKLDVRVQIVSFDKSTKVKALNKTMSEIEDDFYDIAVVLDADNVMHEDFLEKMNNAYNNGYKYLQGRRVAKNSDTQYSFLDGISEGINNNVFRKGHNNLGFSSAFIGSGMALPYATFKQFMGEVDENSIGEDRILQALFIERKLKIKFIEDALVYDEKTGAADNFGNQRKRWLSSQYVFLKENFGRGMLALLKGHIDLFNVIILHNLFLPRVVNLGLLFFYGLAAFLLKSFTTINWLIPLGMAAVYYFSTVIVIPKKFWDKRLFKAMLRLPQAFFIMGLNLFKLKGANKNFIHTKHSKVNIDQEIKN